MIRTTIARCPSCFCWSSHLAELLAQASPGKRTVCTSCGEVLVFQGVGASPLIIRPITPAEMFVLHVEDPAEGQALAMISRAVRRRAARSLRAICVSGPCKPFSLPPGGWWITQ